MSIDGNELKSRIRDEGAKLGLSRIGFALPNRPERHAKYAEWLEAGHAGTMTYLHRQAEKRGDPRLVLPGAQTLISVAQTYFQGWLPDSVRKDASRGLIAAYAWEADYHDVLLEKLKSLAARIEEWVPGSKNLCYVDTGPISERDHAERAQLGFIGKNTLLIQPRAGSLAFLGEILTTVDLAPDTQTRKPGCGSCTRCLDICPTHAFPAAYVLNSNLCISYLTIEYRGIIPRDLRGKLGNHIFGCDECQECCPWNKRFAETMPNGTATLERRAPKLATLAALSEAEYKERFRGTAILRTSHRAMLRNVVIALGNWGTEEAWEILEPLLAHNEPLVRAHAVWAAKKVDSQSAQSAIQRLAARETNAEVCAEIASS